LPKAAPTVRTYDFRFVVFRRLVSEEFGR